jgi:uncharacterized protein (TIGR02118 family)
MAGEPKVVVTTLYPRHETSTFDTEYYLKHHIPMTRTIWGEHGMISCKVYAVEKDSGFAMKTITTWKNMDDWKAAQGADSTKKIMAEVDSFKFTNVKPIMVVGKWVG